MARKKKLTIKSLKELSLKISLDSLLGDIYLIHAANNDLSSSIYLSNLRIGTKEEWLTTISQRLNILPGLLNDEVREELIRNFFNSSSPSWQKYKEIQQDFLKVVLNDSMTSLNIPVDISREALSIIAKQCPLIEKLKLLLQEESYWDILSEKSSLGDSITEEKTYFSNSSKQPPLKRRKLSAIISGDAERKDSLNGNGSDTGRILGTPSAVARFEHLREVFLGFGASNALLGSLGAYSPHLQKLSVSNSTLVNDEGIKLLCLKRPDIHAVKEGGNLHDLRVRSFHLNKCCRSLKEMDMYGTNITKYGVAFLLKHLPFLRDLGSVYFVPDAIELLVCKKTLAAAENGSLSAFRRPVTRYKLNKIGGSCVSSGRFILISSLCPELEELSLCQRRQDAWRQDLNFISNEKSINAHISRLKQLKELTMLRVGAQTTELFLKVIGHQLTYIRVLCHGFRLPTLLESCPNLVTIVLAGSQVSAPQHALAALGNKAAKKLERLELDSKIPVDYLNLILGNSGKLVEITIRSATELTDAMVESLVRRGKFSRLKTICIDKAPELTSKAAMTILHKCPTITHLGDLGGWNITPSQCRKIMQEIKTESFDVDMSYTAKGEAESDVSSVGSFDYPLDLFSVFQDIFPGLML